MDNEISLILTWAQEKNLIHGSDKKTEILKLFSAYGKLVRELNKGSNCCEVIGECLIYLIIICKMENIALEDTLEKTKNIYDVRIKDVDHVLKVMAYYLGQLAEDVLTNRNVKTGVGYILIYLTTLTKVLNYSFSDCLEKAYFRVKKNKDIMFDGSYVGVTDMRYTEAKNLIKHRKLKDGE